MFLFFQNHEEGQHDPFARINFSSADRNIAYRKEEIIKVKLILFISFYAFIAFLLYICRRNENDKERNHHLFLSGKERKSIL